MSHSTRALAMFVMMILLVAGCSHAGRAQRVGEATPSGMSAPVASAPAATVPTDATRPIPGHPPVDTSGIVASYDPANLILTFQDGRRVRLTPQSQVLRVTGQAPVDASSIQPGQPVVVKNGMPLVTRSAKASGKSQRMGKVKSVDQANQTVLLTDGSTVSVGKATDMHMGMSGPAIVLTDLQPGDELVIVMVDDTAAAAPSSGTGSSTAAGAPSALPRAASTPPPSDAAELMVFRPQAP